MFWDYDSGKRYTGMIFCWWEEIIFGHKIYMSDILLGVEYDLSIRYTGIVFCWEEIMIWS